MKYFMLFILATYSSCSTHTGLALNLAGILFTKLQVTMKNLKYILFIMNAIILFSSSCASGKNIKKL
jgi:hypothetical protein